mmetsp:Transcript_83431/g.232695  ORF Transcript_83431/g.232695 Transcript_83431/m.232695 type:complete len:217 (+) Transcript_83431:276-926(+)
MGAGARARTCALPHRTVARPEPAVRPWARRCERAGKGTLRGGARRRYIHRCAHCRGRWRRGKRRDTQRPGRRQWLWRRCLRLRGDVRFWAVDGASSERGRTWYLWLWVRRGPRVCESPTSGPATPRAPRQQALATGRAGSVPDRLRQFERHLWGPPRFHQGRPFWRAGGRPRPHRTEWPFRRAARQRWPFQLAGRERLRVRGPWRRRCCRERRNGC